MDSAAGSPSQSPTVRDTRPATACATRAMCPMGRRLGIQQQSQRHRTPAMSVGLRWRRSLRHQPHRSSISSSISISSSSRLYSKRKSRSNSSRFHCMVRSCHRQGQHRRRAAVPAVRSWVTRMRTASTASNHRSQGRVHRTLGPQALTAASAMGPLAATLPPTAALEMDPPIAMAASAMDLQAAISV